MKRLFFALWPDAEVKAQCAKIIHGFDNGKGRKIPPENLHVTLLFLGNISNEKELALKEAIRGVFIPDIELCFNKLSFWKKPGILCLTASKIDPALIKLVDNLSSAAKKLGITVDEHTYHPHVTLFRKVNGIAGYNFEPITWQSSSICLVESTLILQSSEYRVIETWHAA